MNQSSIRKAKYGVVDPKATAEENAGKYGSPDCPGAGLGASWHSWSKGRSYGTIGARNASGQYLRGRSFFKSTEAGSLQETGARQKNPTLPKPERFTYQNPRRQLRRAREGKDLQANA